MSGSVIIIFEIPIKFDFSILVVSLCRVLLNYNFHFLLSLFHVNTSWKNLHCMSLHNISSSIQTCDVNAFLDVIILLLFQGGITPRFG